MISKLARAFITATLSFIFSLTAHAATFNLPSNGNVIGQVLVIHAQKGDTLHSLAKHYDIGWLRMRDANRHLIGKNLKPGSQVVIPQRFILPKLRKGIVVNLAELRLYYFPADKNVVYTYPVGVGRNQWRTPTLKTIVYRKKELPTWYIPESIRDETLLKKGKFLPSKIGPGPKNPLGSYAMYLLERGYLIHGNNAPDTIGTYASSGCIRMFNHDVEQLFHLVPNRTPVTIIHHANKVGTRGNTLYLEVHRAMSHSEQPNELNYTDAIAEIKSAIYGKESKINWRKVQLAEKQHTGIPIRIGTLY